MKKQVVTHPDMPAPYGAYSTVVRAGDFLFVSGQAGIVPETGQKAGEDFETQARQACNNMKMIVDEGARMGAPMPTSQVMLDLVEEAARAGWQDEDMIAMTKVLARSSV